MEISLTFLCFFLGKRGFISVKFTRMPTHKNFQLKASGSSILRGGGNFRWQLVLHYNIICERPSESECWRPQGNGDGFCFIKPSSSQGSASCCSRCHMMTLKPRRRKPGAKAGGLKKGTEPSCIGIDDFANQPTPREQRRFGWIPGGEQTRTGRMRCKQYFF